MRQFSLLDAYDNHPMIIPPILGSFLDFYEKVLPQDSRYFFDWQGIKCDGKN